MLKAILALGAVAAVAVGLALPAPALNGPAGHFMQPGVYSR